GERRNANSSLRAPPSHTKRRSERSACPNADFASRGRSSSEYGTPSEPSTVSSGARQRSSESQTIAIAAGAVPARISSSSSSATSSSAPRAPAPSKKRIAPPSSGGSAAASSKSDRSRYASVGCATSPKRGGSSSIRPPASAARSSAVRRSDAKATPPGSYGRE